MTGGFVLGVEASTGEGLKGGAFGAFTFSDFNSAAGDGSASTVHAGVNAAFEKNGFAIRTGGAIAFTTAEMSRTIAFTGFNSTLTSSDSRFGGQAFGELAYAFGLSGGTIEPFAQVAGVFYDGGSVNEAGGLGALSGSVNDMRSVFTTLGLRGSTNIKTGAGEVALRGSLGWRHVLGDVTPTATLNFGSAASSFTVAGLPIARDAAVVEGSADWVISQGTAIGLSYSGVLAKGVQEHALKAQFQRKF